MSYDINLCDPVTHDTLFFETSHFMAGGNYAIGGTNEAWLNVTWNYDKWYYKDGVFPLVDGEKKGIRTIYGLSGAESIAILKNAIHTLESMSEDISEEERRKYEQHGVTGYWMPTKENAIRPLYQLLAFAQVRPDGVWEGD